ncbi:MAG: DUF371 domain-containing protein [Nitrososphaerales archaeon]|nr:DUF371 domain-containing protein [Nitrososphaerales archaeon]
MMAERISFRGHPMVLGLHPTTIEITTDEHLTRNGDCIIGVSSERGCEGLSEEVKEALRGSGTRVSLRFFVNGESFLVTGRGDPRLTLSDPHDMVIRKSDFVSDRTLALGASAAAKDIPRSMVKALKDEKAKGYLEIGVQRVD